LASAASAGAFASGAIGTLMFGPRMSASPQKHAAQSGSAFCAVWNGALRLGVVEREREPQALVEVRLGARALRRDAERERAEVAVDRHLASCRLHRLRLERQGLGLRHCGEEQPRLPRDAAERSARRRAAGIEQGVERRVGARSRGRAEPLAVDEGEAREQQAGGGERERESAKRRTDDRSVHGSALLVGAANGARGASSRSSMRS
jgi:hypothetical protein